MQKVYHMWIKLLILELTWTKLRSFYVMFLPSVVKQIVELILFFYSKVTSSLLSAFKTCQANCGIQQCCMESVFN